MAYRTLNAFPSALSLHFVVFPTPSLFSSRRLQLPRPQRSIMMQKKWKPKHLLKKKEEYIPERRENNESFTWQNKKCVHKCTRLLVLGRNMTLGSPALSCKALWPNQSDSCTLPSKHSSFSEVWAASRDHLCTINRPLSMPDQLKHQVHFYIGTTALSRSLTGACVMLSRLPG